MLTDLEPAVSMISRIRWKHLQLLNIVGLVKVERTKMISLYGRQKM